MKLSPLPRRHVRDGGRQSAGYEEACSEDESGLRDQGAQGHAEPGRFGSQGRTPEQALGWPGGGCAVGVEEQAPDRK
jgi:hypothetical protein